jgi:hypothetical protein
VGKTQARKTQASKTKASIREAGTWLLVSGMGLGDFEGLAVTSAVQYW